jgi:hypothetical protein
VEGVRLLAPDERPFRRNSIPNLKLDRFSTPLERRFGAFEPLLTPIAGPTLIET